MYYNNKGQEIRDELLRRRRRGRLALWEIFIYLLLLRETTAADVGEAAR